MLKLHGGNPGKFLPSAILAGAAQEALTEQYNDQLRELREAGLADQVEEVREALRALRDEERAPESSVTVCKAAPSL